MRVQHKKSYTLNGELTLSDFPALSQRVLSPVQSQSIFQSQATWALSPSATSRHTKWKQSYSTASEFYKLGYSKTLKQLTTVEIKNGEKIMLDEHANEADSRNMLHTNEISLNKEHDFLLQKLEPLYLAVTAKTQAFPLHFGKNSLYTSICL